MLQRLIVSLALAALCGSAFALPAAKSASPALAGEAPVGETDFMAPITDLYVNAVTGDDNFHCFDLVYPCSTIEGALTRVPSVLTNDITIHIAEGTYAGGFVIADRLSFNRSTIRLVGEPRASIAGPASMANGITIVRVSGIILENLDISGFVGAGVSITYTDPFIIVGSKITNNAGHGLVTYLSRGSIPQTEISGNRLSGITCESGALVIGLADSGGPTGAGSAATVGATSEIIDSGRGRARRIGSALPQSLPTTWNVLIMNNLREGIDTARCQVTFLGSAYIQGNSIGIAARHASEIDLMQRRDVNISGNRTNDMLAECHGMVSNYGSTGVPCSSCDFGLCRP